MNTASQKSLEGTFHFHSTYSHDGKNTPLEIAGALAARGLAFCVMTEHFEDLDAAAFARYVQELDEVTQRTGFIFIPGVEVHLSGLDTIFFPVRDYERIASYERTGSAGGDPVVTVLAHPSKYHFHDVIRHLERYPLSGIEIWNQQADGGHIPPVAFLRMLETQQQPGTSYRYFFGCDLHSANLTVSNVLCIPAGTTRTAEAIAAALQNGEFISRNRSTGIEYRNGTDAADFGDWVRTLNKKTFYRGRLLRTLRRGLRSVYKGLPRSTQHSLNDFKNFVRNKV